MDILQFQINPITAEFKGVSVTFNADAFTPEFFYNAGRRFRETAEENKKREAESEVEKNSTEDGTIRAAISLERTARRLAEDRNIYAMMLSGTPDCPVLLDWAFTRRVIAEDGTVSEVPVPCTEAELKLIKPTLVEELYYWCLETASPKSPETPTTSASPTISETTDAGSVSQDIPMDESLTTLSATQ